MDLHFRLIARYFGFLGILVSVPGVIDGDVNREKQRKSRGNLDPKAIGFLNNEMLQL